MKCCSIRHCSEFMIHALETGFYKWGCLVGRRPKLVIASALILCLLSGIGFLNFREEKDNGKLWSPENSEGAAAATWLSDKNNNDLRFQSALIEAKNVLTKHVFLAMMKMYEDVEAIKSNNNTWSSLCAKRPVMKERFGAKPPVSTTESPEGVDPSFETYTQVCRPASSNNQKCWLMSLLEMFEYNRTKIEELEDKDIVDAVNTMDVSSVYGGPANYKSMLGAVTTNSSGHITGAGAAKMTWILKIDLDKTIFEGFQKVDQAVFDWEAEFIKVMQTEVEHPSFVNVWIASGRSQKDEGGGTIQKDLKLMAMGYLIVFIYIFIMLGDFNRLEQKAWLSVIGLFSVGLSLLVAFGVCSMFGVLYGPIHQILPFLLIGIGIDDMFVLMECYKNIPEEEKMKTVDEQTGGALKHAGVAITITSVTDFVAFMVGSVTVLPGLRAFCIYAAVGILCLYLLQISLFAAFFSLDLQRVLNRRDACCCCLTLGPEWTPNACSQKEFGKRVAGRIGSVILKTPAKIVIILLSVGLLGFNIFGTISLKQKFDSIWFLPPDSYLYRYAINSDKYFPNTGEKTVLYFGSLDYGSELEKFETLAQKLNEIKNKVDEVETWYEPFRDYVNKNHNRGVPNEKLTEDEFQDLLSNFLYSSVGSRFQASFLFNGELKCGIKAPPIIFSKFDITFRLQEDSTTEIKAMNEVKKIIKDINFNSGDGQVHFYGRPIVQWETNEVIQAELYRNIGIALLCILVMTLILLADVVASLMVLLCVLMTLVGVGSLMHFWNLTIDTVTCIQLVIAIGLSVDYSAHMAHTFMTEGGTRNERALATMKDISPAVFNGGFSTFLAFILLGLSKSYVFKTFFRVFFGVVFYGMFHGLLFLPVLLSLIGPPSYESANLHTDVISPTKSSRPNLSSSMNGFKNTMDDEHKLSENSKEVRHEAF